MPAKITPENAAARRDAILQAARWCFLNFGFSKTSLDDIARRAMISRTLLYKTFRDKENIYTEVFRHWLVSRHPEAQRVAATDLPAASRLYEVCRIMVIEPWSEMVGAPMSSEFFEICERLDPETQQHHVDVSMGCVAGILGDGHAAEVFVLALDGLLAGDPSVEQLERRVRILVDRFSGYASDIAN